MKPNDFLYVPTFRWQFGIGGPKTNIPIRHPKKRHIHDLVGRVGKTHSIAWLDMKGDCSGSKAKFGIYFIDDRGNNSYDETKTPDRRLRKALGLPIHNLVGSECFGYDIPLVGTEEFSVSAMRIARKAFVALGLSRRNITHALAYVVPQYECFVRNGDSFVPQRDLILIRHQLQHADAQHIPFIL